MPETTADEIRDQRARLDDITAERAADPARDATDLDAWRRREADRAELELAAARRLAELQRAADNTRAIDEHRPEPDREECETCGKSLTGGRGTRTAAGMSCIACPGWEPAERALVRSARSWSTDEIPARLAALPDPDVANLYGHSGSLRPHRWDLEHAIGQEAQRRRRPLVHQRADGRQ